MIVDPRTKRHPIGLSSGNALRLGGQLFDFYENRRERWRHMGFPAR